MEMPAFVRTTKNQVVRVPHRGVYDKDAIYKIIDEALICHVGLVQDNQPFVIPMLHARQGDHFLLHGATTSRLIQYVQSGKEICIAITLVDGLVLARSAMHHSMNYRSVVFFGQGHLVQEEDKMSALADLTNRLIPGRWNDARQPNEQELRATAVVAIPIELASAKVRTGPPVDDQDDLSLPVWAGVLPIRQQFLPPEDDPELGDNILVPEYVRNYIKEREGAADDFP
jgi:nitroimidazol reductase NimA-like FMN-containing flavoprotein (pyridoxamine 5'-phosphate oxidase superfamily)